MCTRIISFNLVVITLIALCSMLVGSFFSLPLSELFIAAIVVVLLRKQAQITLNLPKSLLMFVQVILGISVGATISLIELGQTLNVSVVAGLMVCLLLQTGGGFWWLHKREGWHPFEALLGAIPGAMAAILVISESGSKPSSKVVYAHSVRLIILILLAGVISLNGTRIAVSHPLMGSEQWLMLGAIVGLSMLCGKLSIKLGIPAPYMLASLLIAAAFNSFVPTFSFAMPIHLVLFATALLGVLIGVRLAETTLREAACYSKAGVIVTLIGLMVAVGVSWIAAHLLGMSWLVLLLSWVPGSVEAMTAVALLLGLEPAFVMVNHAIRLLLLYTMPALFKKQLEQLRPSEQ
ncbi:AbrB family transcriptional regulator [Vibrio metschnikovii]|uniref:AbrB family transcriptional regulator n=1 Tax=Vibrio metschnikovii TaxID=28172 RepID=UPI00165DA1FD|nr:AbrB family transcriptional regulator [Vibrio metschnikovii]EKO3676574.1 AbrB family transcriptional regulator [Vibrio metschnikovii]